MPEHLHPDADIQEGTEGEQVEWERGGRLCPVGAGNATAASCVPPLDCCDLRTTYGCGVKLLSASKRLFLPHVIMLSSIEWLG